MSISEYLELMSRFQRKRAKQTRRITIGSRDCYDSRAPLFTSILRSSEALTACTPTPVWQNPRIPMESQSIRTASSYINNLLLSRGLLRNGAPIEFALPDKAEGGLDATMAKIMNLVHDLILRRDVSHFVVFVTG
jgi:hypothetical protein